MRKDLLLATECSIAKDYCTMYPPAELVKDSKVSSFLQRGALGSKRMGQNRKRSNSFDRRLEWTD